MQENENLIEEEVAQKSPVFLIVLCVLSWISAASSGFFSLVNLLFYESRKHNSLMELELKKEEYEILPSSDINDLAIEITEATIVSVEKFFAHINTSNFIVAVVSALAVYWMFKRLKKGFYLYAAIHILAFIPAYLYMTPSSISGTLMLLNVFFTLLFVTLYATQLKKMK